MSSSLTDAQQNDACDAVIDAPEGDLIELPAEQGVDTASASSPHGKRKADPTYHWVILGMCVAALLLSVLMSVEGRTQVLMPLLGKPLPELCHMRRYTGIDCPGCGLTRSFISIAHGRLLDAWRYNPAAFLLFPLMLFQIPFRAAQIWRFRRGLPEFQLGWIGRGAMIAVVVVLLTQWVVRQLGVGF